MKETHSTAGHTRPPPGWIALGAIRPMGRDLPARFEIDLLVGRSHDIPELLDDFTAREIVDVHHVHSRVLEEFGAPLWVPNALRTPEAWRRFVEAEIGRHIAREFETEGES